MFLGKQLFFRSTGDLVDSKWKQPDIEKLMKLALAIKQRVNKLIPVNCSSWELSAKIITSFDTWNDLKVSDNLSMIST